MARPLDTRPTRLILGIGAATAAAHIGNNFTTYLIGGLIDRYGFTPLQMGAWSMAESLAYAAAMFLLAPRATRLSPRLLFGVAGVLVIAAQLIASATAAYPVLLATRVATGIGFGTANAAVNLAAGRTAQPARAISLGITVQTLLYAAVNIALPLIGERYGVAGMFVALAALSAALLLGVLSLPTGTVPVATDAITPLHAVRGDQLPVLLAMALFAFGSLAIWPFMERAAHAIGLSAVVFGRLQSIATLASALGNVVLAVMVTRMRRGRALVAALLVCGAACLVLTTITSPVIFAIALIAYNVSWFVTYPLLLGIGFSVDASGRLAVQCSAVWLLMMAFGSLSAGALAERFGGYAPAGLLGLALCVAAAAVCWPLARRLDAARAPVMRDAQPSTAG